MHGDATGKIMYGDATGKIVHGFEVESDFCVVTGEKPAWADKVMHGLVPGKALHGELLGTHEVRNLHGLARLSCIGPHEVGRSCMGTHEDGRSCVWLRLSWTSV